MNRAERRRQEKDDERLIAGGIDIEKRDHGQIMALMRLVHREVVAARKAGSVAGIFDFFLGNLAKTDVQAPRDSIACRKGCSHCCKMWVSATAPEIFHLVGAMRKARLNIPTILEKSRVTESLDFDARATAIHDCPLLAGDTCTVYSARPVVCRTAASSDADICRRGYLELSGEPIPMPAFFNVQRVGYWMALRGAFLHAGLRLEAYELNAALVVAIETEDAERRWLAGENVFAGVQQDPLPNPVDDPTSRRFFAETFGALK